MPESKKINSDKYTLTDFYRVGSNDIFEKAKQFYLQIKDFKEKGHYTYERMSLGSCKNRVTILDPYTNKPKEFIMLASNSYLGLTDHPKVIEAAIVAAKKYGVGSGAVPLFGGTYDLHKKLEAGLARMKSCEEAMLFTSGYAANIGCITGLIREGDFIINDALNHASLLDASKYSGGIFKIYLHNDTDSLERKLKSIKGKPGGKLIITDGVFSMDGDIANLPAIKKLADKHGARIMIDEAHATGVLGENGKGTLSHFRMEGKIDIVMGTLSKALGGLGGFVASTKEVIQYLRIYARTNMFSTSLPPLICAALSKSLEILEEEPQRLKNLWENIAYLKKNLKKIGFNVSNSQSAIIPIIIGDEIKLRKISKRLHELGIYVNPVIYPAVPKNLSRLRLSVMATHSQEDLNIALEAFSKINKEFHLTK